MLYMILLIQHKIIKLLFKLTIIFLLFLKLSLITIIQLLNNNLLNLFFVIRNFEKRIYELLRNIFILKILIKLC
jgi:hypothetical protein